MRPRHYAGESRANPISPGPTRIRFNEAPALRRGKFAGSPWGICEPGCFNEAPALRRGKSRRSLGFAAQRRPASMRPRHYAGESKSMFRAGTHSSGGFNEAPALRRGKCRLDRRRVRLQAGRFNEAPALRRGKYDCRACSRRYGRGFNEAPALRRGKCRSHVAFQYRPSGFNEAPALRRGKSVNPRQISAAWCSLQ